MQLETWEGLICDDCDSPATHAQLSLSDLERHSDVVIVQVLCDDCFRANVSDLRWIQKETQHLVTGADDAGPELSTGNAAAESMCVSQSAGPNNQLAGNPEKAPAGAQLLSKEDWIEIYYALDTKKSQIEKGEFSMDDRADSVAWAQHLRSIMQTIGPDGCHMY